MRSCSIDQKRQEDHRFRTSGWLFELYRSEWRCSSLVSRIVLNDRLTRKTTKFWWLVSAVKVTPSVIFRVSVSKSSKWPTSPFGHCFVKRKNDHDRKRVFRRNNNVNVKSLFSLDCCCCCCCYHQSKRKQEEEEQPTWNMWLVQHANLVWSDGSGVFTGCEARQHFRHRSSLSYIYSLSRIPSHELV